MIMKRFRRQSVAAILAVLIAVPLLASTNPKLTNTGANAMINAAAALANSGFMDLYTASQPATADTAVSGQTCLASLTLNATAFAAASSGTATANAITSDSDADATGTAAWFRVYKSDHTACNDATGTRLWDGSVGTSSADLVLPTTSIVQHAIVGVTSYTITQSKG